MKRPSYPGKTISVLKKLEKDFKHAKDFLPPIQSVYEKAYDARLPLIDCVHFPLLDKDKIAALSEHDASFGLRNFWWNIDVLLIYDTKSIGDSVESLLDGLLWSVGSCAEIPLALTARALLEHAAAIYCLSERVAKSSARIAAARQKDFHGDLTDDDRNLHKDLLCFSLGGRSGWPGTGFPTQDASISEWDRYEKSMEKSIPDDLKSDGVTKCIDRASKIEGHRHLGVAYNMLSEYCHPNSAARSMNYSGATRNGISYRSQVLQNEFSSGFLNLFHIVSGLVVPSACTLIFHGLDVVSTCLPEIPPYESKHRLEIPPQGHFRAFDGYGRRIWTTVPSSPLTPEKWPELTDAQKERIKLLYREVEGVDSRDLSFRLNSIRSDMDPESEIDLYAKHIKVFKDEMCIRGNADRESQQMIFAVIQESSGFESFDQMLSAYPILKRVNSLERVFQSARRVK